MLLAKACVTRIKQTQDGWTLEGTAYGEPLDLERHETHTEVKAATFSGLEYRHEGESHVVQCILDV